MIESERAKQHAGFRKMLVVTLTYTDGTQGIYLFTSASKQDVAEWLADSIGEQVCRIDIGAATSQQVGNVGHGVYFIKTIKPEGLND